MKAPVGKIARLPESIREQLNQRLLDGVIGKEIVSWLNSLPEVNRVMTELFGGFPQAFYSAYAEAAPPAQGYAVRKMLYNLYHVLNHANLFGGGYAGQAKVMIERLLAELR